MKADPRIRTPRGRSRGASRSDRRTTRRQTSAATAPSRHAAHPSTPPPQPSPSQHPRQPQQPAFSAPAPRPRPPPTPLALNPPALDTPPPSNSPLPEPRSRLRQPRYNRHSSAFVRLDPRLQSWRVSHLVRRCVPSTRGPKPMAAHLRKGAKQRTYLAPPPNLSRSDALARSVCFSRRAARAS